MKSEKFNIAFDRLILPLLQKTKPVSPMNLFKIILSISLTIVISITETLAQDCGCTHTIEPSNVTDGEENGFLPGDTICVKGGDYGPLFWKNINGTADKPIIIKNCDGQVTMSGTTYGWKWHTSKHFKILGNGDENHEYGFKVSTTSSFFMPMEYFTTNFEIAYVEVVGEEEEGGDIYEGFAGIGLKTSPYQDCDLFQVQGAWTMEDVSVHHNYIHQVGGEGIYAGHGFHQGREEASCPDGVFTYPHAIHNLHVYNNRIEDVGFDGIQIKNGNQNTLVHDNTIYNYGLRDEGAHNEGLFIGESTEGSFYNNWIEKGTGHGIQVNAYGNSKFHNNLIIDSEDNGVYLNNKSASFENKDGTFEFFHNTFVNMGGEAFENYTPQDILLKNNIFVNYTGSQDEKLDSEGDIYTNDINSIGFVDPEASNYNVMETSIAVDAGVQINGLDFDINNNPRSDGKPDVGAYEFSPLTLSLVSNTDMQIEEDKEVTTDAVLKQIVVYSMTGFHLKTIKINSKTFTKSELDLNPGLYVLRNLYQDGAIDVKKILIIE